MKAVTAKIEVSPQTVKHSISKDVNIKSKSSVVVFFPSSSHPFFLFAISIFFPFPFLFFFFSSFASGLGLFLRLQFPYVRFQNSS